MAGEVWKAMTREELLDVIHRAARKGWTELDLSWRGITELPAEIGQLTNLQRLDLDRNQLTSLPEAIGQLTNLQELFLSHNQLTSLPEAIGQLTNLQGLFLSRNQLTSLPESIGQLTNLQTLELSRNKLASLPKQISRLTKLQTLHLGIDLLSRIPPLSSKITGNLLKTLPSEIEQLTVLRHLDLSYNQLTSLPPSLARLEKLKTLNLDDNPLNPALQSAYEAGLPELMAYLRSLEEAEPLYEARLILVGEGGVGKTTLLKALMGRQEEPPREGEPTTHGVQIDVHALRLPHPDQEGVEIRLNAWDFGGQEVYRVTHQFFFSRRSLYLLVWEPRAGVQQCQVEDWLRLIRLRVGDDARVLIVSTHCRTGGRIARIDQPVFMRDFGDMIAGFYEVDSLVDDPATGEKVGVAELKQAVTAAAAGLEQMGMPFGRDWREARDELLQLGRRVPLLSYADFGTVCARHNLDEISTRTLAILMHDLGYIVYYGDDERLRDDIVLQPEWLTKAIGFVLEDRATQEMDGILPDHRLHEVWWDKPADGKTRFQPRLYPFFLRLMEKYDVSYRLPDGAASLVAQHVPQVRPDLPWLPEAASPADQRRIALVCSMDEEPPGLVPWMIVRTHDYATEQRCADGDVHRLHWQKGMFLRHKPHGEALLEQRGREFHVYAQAVWPEYFMNVLQHTLHKLITDNWPGLEGRYRFTVPCPARSDGKPCAGRFNIDALHRFLAEGDRTIRCQECHRRQSIAELLFGFEDLDLSEQLRDIEARLDGLDSRIANYVMALMHAIADEAKHGPRLFTVLPVSPGGARKVFVKRYRLHLWCEAEGCQHPVVKKGKGFYEFDASREWVKRAVPYASFVLNLLKTALPMAAPAIDVYFGADTVKNWGIKAHLDLAKGLVGKLPSAVKVSDLPRLRQGMLNEAERSGILALHAFLREEDPNQERLGLHRVATYTGDYLWLCRKHYEDWQPKIPDKIE